MCAQSQLEAITGLESCADLHVLGDLQTLNVEALRTPPQITTFIKQQKQTALDLTRGRHSEKGLTSFCANMDGLLSRPGLRMDYIHFSAIITAAAHVWTEAQRRDRFGAIIDLRERLEALFQRCLQSKRCWQTWEHERSAMCCGHQQP